MSFQGPPLRMQTSEPVLSVGGMIWDLSNLCSTQNESYSLPTNRRLDQPRREQSIYPSEDDLRRHLPADIDTSDIFDRSRTPLGALRLPNCAKDVVDHLNFPSLDDPRCSQLLSRDPAARDADEFSDCCYEPQERDYSRRKEHGCSQYEMPHDPLPMLGSISDCSSDVSSSHSSRHSVKRERKPVQVEVYPGEFLQLRGAKETFEAIARGNSKSVVCVACGLGLRCVADCELVICPDCRIMSPTPRRRTASFFKDAKCEAKDSTFHKNRRSLTKFAPLWSDEDESFHSSKQTTSVVSAGGVGLGLRIETCEIV
jgi:hypothetical protein